MFSLDLCLKLRGGETKALDCLVYKFGVYKMAKSPACKRSWRLATSCSLVLAASLDCLFFIKQ